jgi:hypothetical protein
VVIQGPGEAEAAAAVPDAVPPVEPSTLGIGKAVEHPVAPLLRKNAHAVDGEPVVVTLRRGADTWTSYSVIRVNVTGQKIERIADYIHCPW